MLIDDFKKANVDAMKSKNQNIKNIIGIVINKYMLLSYEKKALGQEMTDADMVNIIIKTEKELAEEIANYKKVNNTTMSDLATAQSEFITKFLPSMLDESKIKEIILALQDKSIPSVMKHFKANYDGQVDMRLVQQVLKTL